MNDKKNISQYLWILSTIYLFLGLFNVLFALLGILCFLIPLIISISSGSKAYCNSYCGRGQLLDVIGKDLKLSRNKPVPKFLRSNFFRYGFLIFFMVMFGNMIFNTYLVFKGTSSLKEILTILWTFKLPWHFTELSNVTPWISQFAFGFFSIMLTSTILGIITSILFKPRSWCVYCPMGTITQGICKIKNKLSKS